MNDKRPCPAYVKAKDGTRVYCDGDLGHEGTHCGSRTADEYRRLFAAWHKAKVSA